jgi:hypothetical protein
VNTEVNERSSDWGTLLQAEGRGFDSRYGHWFLSLPNPYSRSMTVGLTQTLTEMSTENVPGGKGRPARKAKTLTAICETIV